MNKILLLDTNFSASPIYDFLLKDNNEVFVVGGNPHDYLAKTVKNYINLDYSNVDQTRNLVEELKIDYIVPGCNDRSYKICAELNTNGYFHGLDSIEIEETINNKEKFRTFASKNKIPVPRLIQLNEVGDFWPIIVKPVDAYSGRGITIVRENEQNLLSASIKRAKEFSNSKTCIIEEYVEGQLYSHSAFMVDGSILIDFIVEEHGTANPFVVDTSRVVYNFSQEMLNQIRESISLMAKELNLVDGLVHTQFIKNGNSFWIIEITRRCPGDLYSQLIEISTGYNYAEAYTKPFLNRKNILSKESLKNDPILRHTISQPIEGYFSSLKFNFPISIEKLIPISLAGDYVKASPFGRIGLLFLRAQAHNELASIFELTLKRELYTIQ